MTTAASNGSGFASLLDRLESAELDARVNLASGLDTALVAVASDERVAAVLRACDEKPEHLAEILERIVTLSRVEVDTRYTSPSDTPLFALLFVIDSCEPLATPAGARAVLRAPATFWAARFAQKLLDDLDLPALAGEDPAAIAALRAVEEALVRALAAPEGPRGLRGLRSTATRAVQEVRFS